MKLDFKRNIGQVMAEKAALQKQDSPQWRPIPHVADSNQQQQDSSLSAILKSIKPFDSDLLLKAKGK